MNAKEAREIVADYPDDNVKAYKAQGYLECLAGPEVMALVECQPCQNCPDQGYWVRPNDNTGEPEQVQCEFCHTNSYSRFKALSQFKEARK